MARRFSQLTLPTFDNPPDLAGLVARLLAGNLDFHDQDSGYASHNLHSFPAKFPPQLPRLFIESLTAPGDTVLDPMCGSGTALVEARFTGRRAVGFDIDPLAVRLSQVKVTSLDADRAQILGGRILRRARVAVEKQGHTLTAELDRRWDGRTRAFVNYWFAPETQVELLALVREIERLDAPGLRAFFELVLSGIIITKSGGVSLAFDLAHTRPHRAKVVINRRGDVLIGHHLLANPTRRSQLLTKTLRSPLEEFAKRLQRNFPGLAAPDVAGPAPLVQFGDAQCLPLPGGSVDLIVTSPPYASNAIDYMRAHKFSLVWLGHSIDDLGRKRGEYIGGESLNGTRFESLPARTEALVAAVAGRDGQRGQAVRRYYSEMSRVLREMRRVLKPGKAAIVVAGTSIIKGLDIQIGECLAEIGGQAGLQVSGIGIRHLDRDRRMLPVGHERDGGSQIQQRMHQEFVIGFHSPQGS